MKRTFILGLSAYYHDSAAALIRDGEIVAAAQEERFTRIRHDAGFPSHAVAYCLSEAGLSAAEVDHVVFYDKPILTFERLLETYLDYAPAGFRSFLQAMPVWMKEKLWTRERIAKELGVESPILFTQHHESHAASAFFPSPFDSAAVLTVDGVGEWATSSYGWGRGNEIQLLAETRFPHSLGLLYSAFTYYVGFRVNSGEYKVMGLAPYGEPKYTDRILDELIDLRDDGSLRLNMRYFNFCQGLTMTNAAFDELFGGPPRKPESKMTQRDMDLARSIQEVTEEAMLRMARHVHKETGEKNLCLAGGVALNCVANGRIMREGPYESVWVQPAAGDAGGAIGAALSVWHQYLGNGRAGQSDNADRQGAFLGPGFSEAEISAALDSLGARYERLPPHGIVAHAAEALAAGKVVGWFQGRMEFGPRALGNRSILGDPRSPEMQKIINLKIKGRESFRPFAPAVLAEFASEYFELDGESPYMSFTAPVREGAGIAAVTHLDRSARIQTVKRDTHGAFYDLIAEFRRLTGCAVVVNTSFNVRGEPIVCTSEDAFRCFMHTEMDVLVCGNHYLRKSAQDTDAAAALRQEAFQLD
ncbi:MAG: carbamoyltransferase [Acidobacteria bacterium]|nr:carbamoyltransferase [Acidobacteriota bacterium]MDA1233430.1 carbamoyltransferase [Acidobacteriota bacterium]